MYQLVFKGECTPGTDLETARNNARALFKASVEQLDRMFSGQPVVIRNKLEQVQAEKYLAVLKKHGMVAYAQPMPGDQHRRPLLRLWPHSRSRHSLRHQSRRNRKRNPVTLQPLNRAIACQWPAKRWMIFWPVPA